MRRPKHDGLVTMTQARSLNDLPPHPPKRVGILKKPGTKKDRPLSDSFENLRMVEKQGIVDFYLNTAISDKTVELPRAHSLDMLLTEVDGDDGIHSEPSSTSQLSLNEPNDSQDSFTSDCDSPKSRSRSDSDKLSIGSHQASSTLSLNDVCISRLSPASSQEDLKWIKKGSLFSRISFKKSKSLTSLDVKDKPLLNDDGKRFQ